MKLHEYYNLLQLSPERDKAELWATERGKPVYLCNKETPENLHSLTLGQYIMLCSASTDSDLIAVIEKVFGINGIMNEDAAKALGFMSWVCNELNNIMKLFNKTRIPPTQDEKNAGVDKLKFGVFGLVDWYALRMRCSHDEAESTPWIRVYKCLDIDAQKARYDRRYRELMLNKRKNKQ